MSTYETQKITNYERRRKKDLMANNPRCIFCGEYCPFGDLAHIIRKSQTSKKHSRLALFTMDRNNGLAHRECHKVWDDHPKAIITLHKHRQCLKIMKEIDEDIYNQFILNMEK